MKFSRNDFFLRKVFVTDIIIMLRFRMCFCSNICFKVFLLSLKLWLFLCVRIICIGYGFFIILLEFIRLLFL